MQKKPAQIPVLVFLLIPFVFSGCAGIYLGGGGAFNFGGNDPHSYQSVSGEMVYFPALSSGTGFYAEIGKAEKDGTFSLSYTMSWQEASYLSQTVKTAYCDVSLGGRFIFSDINILAAKLSVPASVSYQWLAVPGAARYGSSVKDASFSGFGAAAGLGLVVPVSRELVINGDLLWRINSYGSAAGGKSGGKLNESALWAGPVIKAGIGYMME